MDSNGGMEDIRETCDLGNVAMTGMRATVRKSYMIFLTLIFYVCIQFTRSSRNTGDSPHLLH